VDLLEREPQLTSLRAAYAEAVAGRGGVVLVEGEAGIGKTSLVSCFTEPLGGEARVLWGSCDDLSIPRPFGPLVDLAGEVSSALADELHGASRLDEVRRLVLAELAGPAPTVMVLEDLHWADAATLDLITVVGRRISGLPGLLVLTYRPGEVAPEHPLWRTLAALSGGRARHLALASLSWEAVRDLVGKDVDRVYAMTGGNPFFVAELAASAPDALPPSISYAVLGRVSRLPEESRRLLELVSMVPSQLAPALLDHVVPGWTQAAEAPERHRLLIIGPTQVRFRHELVRAAVRSSVPVARRRELHARLLRALLELGADAADIVHHAEEAGDLDVVAAQAPIAARRAAALGSHREAYAHFRRAAEFAGRWDPADRARLHEELADSAYAVDRLSAGLPELERALELYRELADQEAVARCLRRRSRFHWYAGDGAGAREDADAAVHTAESLGDSGELARCCSTVAQLAMLAADLPEARRWGRRAVELAERSGDSETRAHALVTLGVSDIIEDPDDWVPLLAAHETADRLGERHEAARALVGLADANFCWVQPALAERFNGQGLAYCREHQVDTLLAFLSAMQAWHLARRGEWAAASGLASAEAARGSTVTQLLAEVVLAELALRGGHPDTAARLDRVRDLAERSEEIQWVCPVVELEVEQALLHDLPMPRVRLEHAQRVAGAGWVDGWAGPRLTAWAALAGVDLPRVPRQSAPHAAMARGDWVAAASAYAEVGWVYDQALMLSLADDEAALAEALSIARRLGAEPLAHRVQRRMRALGLRVRRGPQRATRANAAGLTERELEVLGLLAEGLTNAEIAERLTLSPRTAERHVSAVLGKLGAEGRVQAVRRAAGLGLLNDPVDTAHGAP
jgi:DNA-binding CsgD family transcriptional regulator/tetratricopeptide (TPR) repeat protein